MKLSHKNRARHDRRVANRKAFRLGFPVFVMKQVRPIDTNTLPFNEAEISYKHSGMYLTTGSTAKIVTDAYGSRYKGRRVEVVEVLDGAGGVIVKAPNRKSPFCVLVEHLRAA